MANEPDAPAYPYRSLNERLKNSDQEAEIELYYELLSSGRSVGEILSGIGPARGQSEYDETTRPGQPQSEADRASTEVAADIVVAGTAQAYEPSNRDLVLTRDAQIRGTETPRESQSEPGEELGSDDWTKLFSDTFAGAECNIAGLASARASAAPEAAPDLANRERFWSGKLPSVAKSVAFWGFYTGAVASASIAGFSILQAGRDMKPVIAGDRPHVSGEPGSIATLGSTAEPPAAAKPDMRDVSSGALQASVPTSIGEPDTAAPGAAGEQSQSGAVEDSKIASAAPREADATLRSEAGLRDSVDQLIEQLSIAGAVRSGGAREDAAIRAQSPSAALNAPAGATGHPDTGPLHRSTTPQAPEADTKSAAIGPTEKVSAPPPSRAHATRKHRANNSRRYAGSARSVRRQTATYSRPVYDGRWPDRYDGDPARGYGNGAYGPAPISDNGD